MNQEYQIVNRSTHNDDKLFQPLAPIEIYQIATCSIEVGTEQNETKRKYHELRITYIGEYNNVENVITKYLTKKQYKYILKNVPKNIYKLYSVYHLNTIPLPSVYDIMTARSENLK